MTKEYHIDFYELKHADEYAEEFMEKHIPGPSCAVQEYVVEDGVELEGWESLLQSDLRYLGLKSGERVWIEIDY